MKKVLAVLLLVSVSVNAGLISGWVRIGSPEKLTQTAYNTYERELMAQLVEESNVSSK